jgi:hypothetical protein
VGKRLTVAEFEPSFRLLDRPMPKLVLYSDGALEIVGAGSEPIVVVKPSKSRPKSRGIR